jgi:hypothetical protein
MKFIFLKIFYAENMKLLNTSLRKKVFKKKKKGKNLEKRVKREG